MNTVLSVVHCIYTCPICHKEEDQNNILRCKGTKIWRDEVMDYRIKNTDAEVCTKRRVACKSEEQWQKIVTCMTKYKSKWV
jgi:uridine kinase